jgi:hypothetical protein
MSSDPILSEVDFRPDWPAGWPVSKGNMRSIIHGPHHYIKNGDGREELYDINSDPEERNDLVNATQAQPLIARFRASLEMVLENDRVRE